jgi:hypothetical protein
MVRTKPRGIRLHVWKSLSEEERQEALSCPDRVQQRDVLKRLSILQAGRAIYNTLHDVTGRGAEGNQPPRSPVKKVHRKLPGSKSIRLHGTLEGWTREDRCTATGRQYSVFFSPLGVPHVSRASALRSFEVAAATEGSTEEVSTANPSPPPPAAWVWPREGEAIEVEVEVEGGRTQWAMASVTTVSVDGWFEARIVTHDDEWADWFTWQEEGVDWRRARGASKAEASTSSAAAEQPPTVIVIDDEEEEQAMSGVAAPPPQQQPNVIDEDDSG